MDAESPPNVVMFDEFRFDLRGLSLSRRAQNGMWLPVSLSSRAIAILAVLVERAGSLASKDDIMRQVWPATSVEEANLTVQISALRRALDKGRTNGSCIQTIPGRGYRLVAEVVRPKKAVDSCAAQAPHVDNSFNMVNCDTAGAAGDGDTEDATRVAPHAAGSARLSRRLRVGLLAILFAGASVTLAVRLSLGHGEATGRSPPPLSLVMLPFHYAGSDDADTRLIEGIDKDLPRFVAGLPGFKVIADDSSIANTATASALRHAGEEMGVRYALAGSAHRVAGTLRLDVDLISTETGARVWADRFAVERDEASDDNTSAIVWALCMAIVQIDAARSERERPEDPSADDVLLQARALTFSASTPERQARLLPLWERAAALNPSSAFAQAGLAEVLLDGNLFAGDPEAPARLRRANDLITRSELLNPRDPKVIWARVYLLGLQNRCAELLPAAERAIDDNPAMPIIRNALHFWLGQCLLRSGQAAEAIPVLQQSIRDNPRNPQNFNRYSHIGLALALLGRFDEAVPWFRKSVAANPSDSVHRRGFMLAAITAALALGGHTEEARREAAETMLMWPTLTARSYYQPEFFSPIAAAQAARFREGLRQAGIRDHADEHADFGVVADHVLHADYEAHTPTTVPGARAIGTHDFAVMLEQQRPLVIDASVPWGTSIPGAIELWGAGVGGSTSDARQDRLGAKMRDLVAGDMNKLVVVLGWNAERYQGRNLALRLVALGYTNVYWYRGGREAWEAAGLPEAELNVQDW